LSGNLSIWKRYIFRKNVYKLFPFISLSFLLQNISGPYFYGQVLRAPNKLKIKGKKMGGTNFVLKAKNV
jgi:hypothetical protein